MTILLVGTDFSTRSDRALRRAMLLARQGGYELLVTAVQEEEDAPAEVSRQARGNPEALLGEMQRTLADEDGIACRAELRTGRAAEQLAEAARESGAALIVIGPHRRRSIRDVFGAITAERIVQKSPVPVLVANGVPAGAYRKLLLPVDLEEGSLPADAAVRTFRMLDFANSAETALLHIYDPEAREILGRAMAPAQDRRDYLAECAIAARNELHGFAVSAGLENAVLLTAESRGSTGENIARIAAEDGYDLIVAARSGKGTIGKAILGSATEDLLRAGEMDVLVAPSA